ncbi:MAG TPA: hypothetical protein VGG29_03455 [Caulobacteraceae bacterium]|jgi:hypothetical protein
MPCTVVQTPLGAAIVCTERRPRPRCRFCGAPAPLLCDWKVPERRSGVCDAPICGGCATSPAEGKDLCPDHAVAWRAWLAARRPQDRQEGDQHAV